MGTRGLRGSRAAGGGDLARGNGGKHKPETRGRDLVELGPQRRRSGLHDYERYALPAGFAVTLLVTAGRGGRGATDSGERGRMTGRRCQAVGVACCVGSWIVRGGWRESLGEGV